jgi:hypothetical protein
MSVVFSIERDGQYPGLYPPPPDLQLCGSAATWATLNQLNSALSAAQASANTSLSPLTIAAIAVGCAVFVAVQIWLVRRAFCSSSHAQFYDFTAASAGVELPPTRAPPVNSKNTQPLNLPPQRRLPHRRRSNVFHYLVLCLVFSMIHPSPPTPLYMCFPSWRGHELSCTCLETHFRGRSKITPTTRTGVGLGHSFQSANKGDQTLKLHFLLSCLCAKTWPSRTKKQVLESDSARKKIMGPTKLVGKPGKNSSLDPLKSVVRVS